jgi:competence transcription factor ComK
MNLSTILLPLFCVFLWRFFKTTSFFTYFFNKNYVLDSRSPQKLISFPV